MSSAAVKRSDKWFRCLLTDCLTSVRVRPCSMAGETVCAVADHDWRRLSDVCRDWWRTDRLKTTVWRLSVYGLARWSPSYKASVCGVLPVPDVLRCSPVFSGVLRRSPTFSGVLRMFSGVLRCSLAFSGCSPAFSGCSSAFSGVLRRSPAVAVVGRCSRLPLSCCSTAVLRWWSPVADRRQLPPLNRWSRGCRSVLLACIQRQCGAVIGGCSPVPPPKRWFSEGRSMPRSNDWWRSRADDRSPFSLKRSSSGSWLTLLSCYCFSMSTAELSWPSPDDDDVLRVLRCSPAFSGSEWLRLRLRLRLRVEWLPTVVWRLSRLMTNRPTEDDCRTSFRVRPCSMIAELQGKCVRCVASPRCSPAFSDVLRRSPAVPRRSPVFSGVLRLSETVWRRLSDVCRDWWRTDRLKTTVWRRSVYGLARWQVKPRVL